MTSPCTVSKIPMSRGADRDNQLKYRVEKESKERGNLIRQVKQHEGIIWYFDDFVLFSNI